MPSSTASIPISYCRDGSKGHTDAEAWAHTEAEGGEQTTCYKEFGVTVGGTNVGKLKSI